MTNLYKSGRPLNVIRPSGMLSVHKGSCERGLNIVANQVNRFGNFLQHTFS